MKVTEKNLEVVLAEWERTNGSIEKKSYEQQLCYELKVQTAQGENYTLFVDALTHEFVKKEKNNG